MILMKSWQIYVEGLCSLMLSASLLSSVTKIGEELCRFTFPAGTCRPEPFLADVFVTFSDMSDRYSFLFIVISLLKR